MKRIGIAGFGHIGKIVLDHIVNDPELGLEPAFVWNRDPAKTADLSEAIRLADLADAAQHKPDLILEAAHPQITRRHGVAFLGFADYLPLSVTALCDPALDAALDAAARNSGHRLLVPHGALPGLDNLVEVRANLSDVHITFEKHPAAIDWSESGLEPDPEERRIVFDGTVSGIADLFPRNVNTMVTCGLATVGLDRCRATLVSDPALDVGIADVRARGKDGSELHMRKEQPMAGVSGTEMAASALGSVIRACGGRHHRDFV